MKYRRNGVRWGQAGAGILFFCKDKVLLTLRSPHVEEGGTWGIPGGSISGEYYYDTEDDDTDSIDLKPDESLAHAWRGAVKETLEELGSIPEAAPFAQVVYQEGNFTYTSFLVEITPTQAKNWKFVFNWENDSAEWFLIKKLPAPLHFGMKFIMKERPDLFNR